MARRQGKKSRQCWIQPWTALRWHWEMEWRVEGTELDIVGGQQTSFGPVLHDGSWHCPIRQHNWLLRIIRVGCWYQHVVLAVQKCDNVVCVVWAEGDMAVEDICNGCTHHFGQNHRRWLCDRRCSFPFCWRWNPASSVKRNWRGLWLALSENKQSLVTVIHHHGVVLHTWKQCWTVWSVLSSSLVLPTTYLCLRFF